MTLTPTELVFKLLEWQELQEKIDALKNEITAEVLGLKSTQTVGIVRATYSGGRATYDYKTPGLDAPSELIGQYSHDDKVVDWEGLAKSFRPDEDLISSYTDITIITDWKIICKELNLKPVVLSRTSPSVTLKLLEVKE